MAPAKKKSEKEETSKAPRARKTAVPSARKRTPAARKSKAVVTPKERMRMIELEAYFVAEKDGFRGDSKNYWITAEAIVNARLSGKK